MPSTSPRTATPALKMTPATASAAQRVSFDMLDPTQTCAALDLTASEVLVFVNQGRLAAYDLGGEIRFRYCDVSAMASRLAIAV